MNYNYTLPMNGGNVVPQVPSMDLKSRTRSLVSQSNRFNSSDANNNSKMNNLSVMDKLKKMFTSRPIANVNNGTNNTTNNNNINKNNYNYNRNNNNNNKNNNNNSIENSSDRNNSNMTNIRPYNGRTRLQRNKKKLSYESSISQYNNTNSFIGNPGNIEWQPVYHETCKIKLPVEPSSTKIEMPQEALEEWANEQAEMSKAMEKFTKMTNGEKDLKENEEENSINQSCFNGTGISQTPCINKSVNKDEPYSKFKYYYNYYLVDDYLDSLAQSQNKKIDASGLGENGELYENVSLMVKPILKTKERLESGVPYDSKVVIN